MSTFTRFNRKHIDDRQIDTLIGLSKGLTADGKINQSEAEVLLGWLVQSRSLTENPIIHNLFERVDEMLSDNLLNSEESQELMATLTSISGDASDIGEIAKTASLPLCNPAPEILFPESRFIFTGTFAYGTRAQCIEAVEKLGGSFSKSVTKFARASHQLVFSLALS